MNHRGERRWVVCILALFLCAESASLALTPKELRRAGKKADAAWKAGRADEAQRLYEEILAGSMPGDSSRQNALYRVVLLRLAGEAGARDSEEIGRLLAEIEENFPRHPRKVEVAVISVWTAEVERIRMEAAKNAAELETLRSEFEETKEVIADEAGDQVKSCEEKLNSTQRSLRRARSELAKKEEELQKKEEALQKLKNAIVGGSGR